jgi:hypothetical protein
MNKLKALWQRLVSKLVRNEPWEAEEQTSEYIPCGNAPKRSAGFLWLKDYK